MSNKFKSEWKINEKLNKKGKNSLEYEYHAKKDGEKITKEQVKEFVEKQRQALLKGGKKNAQIGVAFKFSKQLWCKAYMTDIKQPTQYFEDYEETSELANDKVTGFMIFVNKN